MEYFAFGETFVEEHKNSHNSPYKYNGKELDEETGWYYYGARFYDARVSLWLSVDPLAQNYPSVSPYNYCLNNPIKFIDPTGMSPDGGPGGPQTDGTEDKPVEAGPPVVVTPLTHGKHGGGPYRYQSWSLQINQWRHMGYSDEYIRKSATGYNEKNQRVVNELLDNQQIIDSHLRYIDSWDEYNIACVVSIVGPPILIFGSGYAITLAPEVVAAYESIAAAYEALGIKVAVKGAATLSKTLTKVVRPLIREGLKILDKKGPEALKQFLKSKGVIEALKKIEKKGINITPDKFAKSIQKAIEFIFNQGKNL